MTIVTGIVKKAWDAEQKMVGYFRVDGEQMEINQENIAKVKSIMVDAKAKGIKIEQRKLWLNENLNPLQSA
jgi:tagatose-1,6-bisphosphate aldolase